jgi:hypothetical protein
MYSVDTSTLMDWQARFYPTDVFPGLKARIEGLIGEGRLQAVALVQEEINAIGTPEMRTWAADQTGLYVPPDPALQAQATQIQIRYPDLVDVNNLHEQADPYVIALAKQRNWIVVSQETSAHEKRNPRKRYYIPDVCRDLGISCINLLGLMRREGWSF